MDNPIHVYHSTDKSVRFLLRRGLYTFIDHHVIGKGSFYKKGHLIENWKLRTYVINDFNSDSSNSKEGTFKYFKPQNAQDYNRDTRNSLITNDQKSVKIKKVEFSVGDKNNITKCGTVYQTTAYALNVTFIDGSDKDSYELVFDNKIHAEEFIGAIIQVIGPLSVVNLKRFISSSNLNARKLVLSPRLKFNPTAQTSLCCYKCAPVCNWYDCCGFSSYCTCCCCESYTQGGCVTDEVIHHNNIKGNNLGTSIFANCCLIESIICECRMIKNCMIKFEQQICCIDQRCAFPTDLDVPIEITCCGLKIFGQDPQSKQSSFESEIQPLNEDY